MPYLRSRKFNRLKKIWQELLWTIWQPWDLLSGLLLVLWTTVRPIKRHPSSPWVIGGHRGRLFADNSAALYKYVTQNTSQPIVWIANKSLCATLRQCGVHVLRRNSWPARIAIMRAPVVIYSHGEDDLDQYALFWRKKLGLRVYLNHCMNHIKAGQWYRRDVENMSALRKKLFAWLMTDFDILLASSERERRNFILSFPHRADNIYLGGGAHIDTMITMSQNRAENILLWFPTFRDTRTEQSLVDRTIQLITQDIRLLSWLKQTQRILVICHHINQSASSSSYEQNSSIRYISPASLQTELGRAELFISDYSGILADWLIFDRPAVFFPFDLNSYLRTRRLYVNYAEFHYGPLALNAEELINILISETWRDMTLWEKRRNYWKNQIFPYRESVYARTSYEMICRFLTQSL